MERWPGGTEIRDNSGQASMRQKKLNLITMVISALVLAASLGTAAWRTAFHRVEDERALIETGTDQRPGR